MSDTPRTSAAILPDAHFQHNFQIVPADFARALERELAAAREQITGLQDQIQVRGEMRDEAISEMNEANKKLSAALAKIFDLMNEANRLRAELGQPLVNHVSLIPPPDSAPIPPPPAP